MRNGGRAVNSVYILQSHLNVKLQTAATFCIGNLARNDEVGCSERQARLRELGVHRILQQLLSTNDPTLFERCVGCEKCPLEPDELIVW